MGGVWIVEQIHKDWPGMFWISIIKGKDLLWQIVLLFLSDLRRFTVYLFPKLILPSIPNAKFFEECYLNNQFGDNVVDNHSLHRKCSTDTETIAIER